MLSGIHMYCILLFISDKLLKTCQKFLKITHLYAYINPAFATMALLACKFNGRVYAKALLRGHQGHLDGKQPHYRFYQLMTAIFVSKPQSSI